jgi:hypothetical protein
MIFLRDIRPELSTIDDRLVAVRDLADSPYIQADARLIGCP